MATTTSPVCTIDATTRIITVPAEYKELGVESDERATRINFRCPKIVGDGIDLSALNLYINYENANKKLNSYLVDDVTVSGSNIEFSWLLSRHVTEASGTVRYIVCAKKSDDKEVVNEWNTKVATGTVNAGLEATVEIEEQNADIIEQILKCIVELENNSGGSSGGSSDITLGLTSATVGQIAKIATVDTDGKPTAWEAADLPAGAGETWQFITEITLDDAVNVVTINKDANGNSFALKRVMIDCVITLNTDDPFTNIKTRLNGHVCSDNSTPVMNTSNVRYYSFYAEIIPGSGALCWQACSGANYNWGGDLLKMGYKYNNLWQSDAITSLSIHPNDGLKNIGLAGTKIHVLGVRA